MLNFRGIGHQITRPFKAAAGVFGGDKVWHHIGNLAIIAPGEQALGARQVVMQKARIGERATHIDKKAHHFFVTQGRPTGQRDLKGAKASVMCHLNALDDVGG